METVIDEIQLMRAEEGKCFLHPRQPAAVMNVMDRLTAGRAHS